MGMNNSNDIEKAVEIIAQFDKEHPGTEAIYGGGFDPGLFGPEGPKASMIDAVDLSYYRLYGDVKMSEEKFVENFLRRFAENNSLSKTYTVEFYDMQFKKQRQSFEGWTAQIIQHELDHCDGIII